MKETSVSRSLNVYGAIFNGKCESASFGIKKHSETNFVVFLFILLSSFGMEILITVNIFSWADIFFVNVTRQIQFRKSCDLIGSSHDPAMRKSPDPLQRAPHQVN